MENRTRFGDITRIVAQIAHLAINSVGAVELTPSDIQDALALAALDDLLLHILDCYTYRNFRVSVEGKHLTMHGTKSLTEASYTWSSLRARSRELVDNHRLVEEIKKIESLAESLSCEFDCFSSFLETIPVVGLLQQCATSRTAYAGTLTPD